MAGDHREQRCPFLRARLRVDSRFRLELEQARAHSVPHSIFTGRSWPQPGEPLFLEEDTAGIVALAEEERDSCPACGMPKVWCRDPANQFGVFQVVEEQCHATYLLAAHREKVADRDDATRSAILMMTRFAKGEEPDIYAGLGLEGSDGPEGDPENT